MVGRCWFVKSCAMPPTSSSFGVDLPVTPWYMLYLTRRLDEVILEFPSACCLLSHLMRDLCWESKKLNTITPNATAWWKDSIEPWNPCYVNMQLDLASRVYSTPRKYAWNRSAFAAAYLPLGLDSSGRLSCRSHCSFVRAVYKHYGKLDKNNSKSEIKYSFAWKRRTRKNKEDLGTGPTELLPASTSRNDTRWEFVSAPGYGAIRKVLGLKNRWVEKLIETTIAPATGTSDGATRKATWRRKVSLWTQRKDEVLA